MATISNYRITHKLITSYDVDVTGYNYNFFYANVRSILNSGRLNKLEDIIKSIPNEVQVIVLTETWIETDKEAEQAELDGYKHFFSHRNGDTCGGVSIYVKPDLKPKQTSRDFRELANFLWVHLDAISLDIGAVYNPSSRETSLMQNHTQFLKEYSRQLKGKQQAIVFGDFNVNLLDTVCSRTRAYKEMLAKTGFKSLNKIHEKYCTRMTSWKTGTIIDHVYTNLDASRCQFYLAIVDAKSFSDHRDLYLAMKITNDDSPSNNMPRLDTNDNRTTAPVDDDDTETSSNHSENYENEAENETGFRSSNINTILKYEFVCKNCRKVYTSWACYIKHVRQKHNNFDKITNEYIMIKCFHCGIPITKKGYNRHVTKCYKDLQKYNRSSAAGSTSARAVTNDDDEGIVSNSSDGEEPSSIQASKNNDQEHVKDYISGSDSDSSSDDDRASSGSDGVNSDDDRSNSGSDRSRNDDDRLINDEELQLNVLSDLHKSLKA